MSMQKCFTLDPSENKNLEELLNELSQSKKLIQKIKKNGLLQKYGIESTCEDDRYSKYKSRNDPIKIICNNNLNKKNREGKNEEKVDPDREYPDFISKNNPFKPKNDNVDPLKKYINKDTLFSPKNNLGLLISNENCLFQRILKTVEKENIKNKNEKYKKRHNKLQKIPNKLENINDKVNAENIKNHNEKQLAESFMKSKIIALDKNQTNGKFKNKKKGKVYFNNNKIRYSSVDNVGKCSVNKKNEHIHNSCIAKSGKNNKCSNPSKGINKNISFQNIKEDNIIYKKRGKYISTNYFRNNYDRDENNKIYIYENENRHNKGKKKMRNKSDRKGKYTIKEKLNNIVFYNRTQQSKNYVNRKIKLRNKELELELEKNNHKYFYTFCKNFQLLALKKRKKKKFEILSKSKYEKINVLSKFSQLPNESGNEKVKNETNCKEKIITTYPNDINDDTENPTSINICTGKTNCPNITLKNKEKYIINGIESCQNDIYKSNKSDQEDMQKEMEIHNQMKKVKENHKDNIICENSPQNNARERDIRHTIFNKFFYNNKIKEKDIIDILSFYDKRKNKLKPLLVEENNYLKYLKDNILVDTNICNGISPNENSNISIDAYTNEFIRKFTNTYNNICEKYANEWKCKRFVIKDEFKKDKSEINECLYRLNNYILEKNKLNNECEKLINSFLNNDNINDNTKKEFIFNCIYNDQINFMDIYNQTESRIEKIKKYLNEMEKGNIEKREKKTITNQENIMLKNTLNCDTKKEEILYSEQWNKKSPFNYIETITPKFININLINNKNMYSYIRRKKLNIKRSNFFKNCHLSKSLFKLEKKRVYIIKLYILFSQNITKRINEKQNINLHIFVNDIKIDSRYYCSFTSNNNNKIDLKKYCRSISNNNSIFFIKKNKYYYCYTILDNINSSYRKYSYINSNKITNKLICEYSDILDHVQSSNSTCVTDKDIIIKKGKYFNKKEDENDQIKGGHFLCGITNNVNQFNFPKNDCNDNSNAFYLKSIENIKSNGTTKYTENDSEGEKSESFTDAHDINIGNLFDKSINIITPNISFSKSLGEKINRINTNDNNNEIPNLINSYGLIRSLSIKNNFIFEDNNNDKNLENCLEKNSKIYNKLSISQKNNKDTNFILSNKNEYLIKSINLERSNRNNMYLEFSNNNNNKFSTDPKIYSSGALKNDYLNISDMLHNREERNKNTFRMNIYESNNMNKKENTSKLNNSYTNIMNNLCNNKAKLRQEYKKNNKNEIDAINKEILDKIKKLRNISTKKKKKNPQKLTSKILSHRYNENDTQHNGILDDQLNYEDKLNNISGAYQLRKKNNNDNNNRIKRIKDRIATNAAIYNSKAKKEGNYFDDHSREMLSIIDSDNYIKDNQQNEEHTYKYLYSDNIRRRKHSNGNTQDDNITYDNKDELEKRKYNIIEYKDGNETNGYSIYSDCSSQDILDKSKIFKNTKKNKSNKLEKYSESILEYYKSYNQENTVSYNEEIKNDLNEDAPYDVHKYNQINQLDVNINSNYNTDGESNAINLCLSTKNIVTDEMHEIIEKLRKWNKDLENDNNYIQCIYCNKYLFKLKNLNKKNFNLEKTNNVNKNDCICVICKHKIKILNKYNNNLISENALDIKKEHADDILTENKNNGNNKFEGSVLYLNDPRLENISYENHLKNNNSTDSNSNNENVHAIFNNIDHLNDLKNEYLHYDKSNFNIEYNNEIDSSEIIGNQLYHDKILKPSFNFITSKDNNDKKDSGSDHESKNFTQPNNNSLKSSCLINVKNDVHNSEIYSSRNDNSSEHSIDANKTVYKFFSHENIKYESNTNFSFKIMHSNCTEYINQRKHKKCVRNLHIKNNNPHHNYINICTSSKSEQMETNGKNEHCQNKVQKNRKQYKIIKNNKQNIQSDYSNDMDDDEIIGYINDYRDNFIKSSYPNFNYFHNNTHENCDQTDDIFIGNNYKHFQSNVSNLNIKNTLLKQILCNIPHSNYKKNASLLNKKNHSLNPLLEEERKHRKHYSNNSNINKNTYNLNYKYLYTSFSEQNYPTYSDDDNDSMFYKINSNFI
ncbi:conserved Plasmodium protein, unknown function [Plasmodium yoelii]|uniref:Uncharacterized protein n=3 Tax=Plasmodium yoelii TaxID=5861 RepID=A0AAE9X0G5_PLAYO|nr:conserved Plasmodium protein, unknown function [Plasmodium yoelii]EAA16986.1 hypothetical protein [Plasmodium yoelii yoelii]WBY59762.1 hypothetical protein Py17XNL_001302971 [Plasmodium yoelii yoelii]CDU19725.1 conserved Plasmodium protein, unknown function [Plasmodium yoelii]VTZ80482.1 conserved Plasmodium protein, unknown function [Plasmodium yoelii]|eukprot:XP_725421.1 conserved Plasmodium protein, unknown function [Plasmodium yoelii]